MKNIKKELIILGGGIAGVTAAIYAKRANIDFLLIEKSYIGGKLVNIDNIENYPGYKSISGYDLAYNLNSQLEYNNIVSTIDEIISISKDKDNNFILESSTTCYMCKYLILAIGDTPKGLDNIHNIDKCNNISYCALCDGNFYKNKDIIVVGGGNSAIQEAIYLSNIVNNISIIVRSYIKADKYLIDKLKTISNIKVYEYSSIKDIKLDESNNLEEVNIINKDNIITNIKSKGIFIYIGAKAPTNIIKDLDILDNNGFILVNNNFITRIDNLYAIGDIVSKKVKQLSSAIGDAVIAINDVIKKINN